MIVEFKTAHRNYAENEKSHMVENEDSVMFAQQKFEGKCFKCGKKGHQGSNCWRKTEKWCNKCKSKTHDTKDCRGKNDTVKTAVEIQDNSNSRTFAFTLKRSC